MPKSSSSRCSATSSSCKAGDRLLDIGCGWGGFAKYAASTRGCEVTGISLSDEQIRFAVDYTRGLPVTIRKLDYRDLPDSGLPPFDKVSIVGMIEHVGYKNYAGAHGRRAPDAEAGRLFLLHTIGNCEETTVVDPWIEKYIFRNSMVPAMSQLCGRGRGEVRHRGLGELRALLRADAPGLV